MQWIVLAVMGATVGAVMRRINGLRAGGSLREAGRLYRRAAWVLGLTVYGAMTVQEGVLLASGMLTWQTGLPLHLCSMMGVISLPMLLTGWPFLWHLSLYLGLPGAALALLFPAVLATPWPRATELSFFVMHAGLVLAPILPLGLGRRPSPRGAASAGIFLLAMGAVVISVNDRLGSNYLFVNGAIPGTPLIWLDRWGMAGYRALLAALLVMLLAAEAATIQMILRRKEKTGDVKNSSCLRGRSMIK